MLSRRFLALRRRFRLLESSSLRALNLPAGSPLGVGTREISAGVTGAELGSVVPSKLAVIFDMFVSDGMTMLRKVGVWKGGSEFYKY